ncbi:MAG: Hint domain-containing protein [Cognatishimia sp.]
MTWIALADHQSQMVHKPSVAQGVIAKGTLVVETYVTPQGSPQPLLGVQIAGQSQTELMLTAMPKGGLHFLLRQGAEMTHVAIAHDAEDQADLLRISYAWDTSTGLGSLVLERPGTNKIFHREIRNPQPLTGLLLQELTRASGQRLYCDDLCFVAVANEVMPFGPMPAICTTAPVQTPMGLRAAGTLKRGDTVNTLDGDVVPVLQAIRHTLPARGSFQPVRLRAPYFGLTQDIVVTPEARLVVGGTQVEYLFGSEKVLVPVKHLTSAASACFESGHRLVSYVQLLLPDHEAILVGGTALESLSIGRLRRKKTLLLGTLLRGFETASIPEHTKTAYPVLKQFEAITLAQHRAA